MKYGVNLLKNKEPHKDYEEIISQKEKHHNERMLEFVPDDFKEMPIYSFLRACENTEKKIGKYEFFKKTGNRL